MSFQPSASRGSGPPFLPSRPSTPVTTVIDEFTFSARVGALLMMLDVSELAPVPPE